MSITSASELVNNWNHIAFTFDGSKVVGYINGVPIDSSDGQTLGPTSTADFMIGRLNYGAEFNGFIDDVSLWTRAISPNEVSNSMTGQLIGDENNLIGYWNFNEGTGTSVGNANPNYPNGTLNGASWSTSVCNWLYRSICR